MSGNSGRTPGGGWALTDEEAAEVLRLSELHAPDPPAVRVSNRQQLRIPIRPGEDAVLWVTLPMSAGDWDQLMAVLGAMKPGIVRDQVEAVQARAEEQQ